ncbi:MAG TPA: amidohydrolase family protein, partial [Stellaceae bacterium]|nr:amidohydrolase family protein [Stellaceae bacterium]
MRIIAIEEHFSDPSYRQKTGANEARSYYMSSRSEKLGHDIGKEIDDLGESRLKQMDANGIDVQVLSFNAPIAHGFAPDEAIAMAKSLNDRVGAAIEAHPTRFSGFAALPMSAPEAAADELERCVKDHRMVGAMIHGHSNGRFLDDKAFWPIFARAEQLGVPIFLHPALPNPDVMKGY